MSEAMKMMDTGATTEINTKSTKGCFWLFYSGKEGLFICVDSIENPSSLFFFHYAGRGKENSTNKVLKITRKNSNPRPTMMQFEKGGEKKELPLRARTTLAELWNKWQNTEFFPSHCKLTKASGQTLYTLTCENPTQPSKGN